MTQPAVARSAATSPSRPLDPCDDLSAAPGAFLGEPRAPRWSLRRAAQNMVWIYLVGLVFLVFPASSISESNAPPNQLALQIVLLVLVGIAYTGAAWASDASLRVRWAYVIGFAGLLACFGFWWGWSFVNQGVYVSVLLATLIPWRQARIAIVAVNLAIAAVALGTWDLTPALLALIGSVVGLSTGAGIQAGRVGHRLRRAEQRVAALALADERERIGRDLHDILGHSLTAISIKADLAEKLVDRDPAAARAQIAEVSAIARQSLADVRATAAGIRQVRVATELASARSVLAAAGIEPITPSAVEPMPDATSELFGYVVREAVTNVVRHSEAGRCVITLAADEVTVTDDGKGLSESTSGSGLRGLSERVEAAGGTLVVGPGAGGGTRVRAALRQAQGNGPRAAERQAQRADA